jgi:hypothetical protein
MNRHKVRRRSPLALHREVLRSLQAQVASARGGAAAVLDPAGLGGGVSGGPSLWAGPEERLDSCPPGWA